MTALRPLADLPTHEVVNVPPRLGDTKRGRRR